MGYGADAVAKAERVIELVSEGCALQEATNKVDLSLRVFHQVISGVRELGQSYARVREIRADVVVDEIIGIADDPDIDPNRARNMIEARKWTATKHNPKVYGERIDLNVQSSISITDTRSEALARVLRPMRDPEPTIDVEVVQSHTLSDAGASDSVSDAPKPGQNPPPVPDIFS